MSLIPWKPFNELDRFFNDDDWFLPVFPRAEFTAPAMDVYETKNEVVAKVNLPGFDPQNIDISIENGVLKVKGKVEEKKEEKERNYWRKEIRQGSFERMIQLPCKVNEKEIDATYENGVLKIVMPKIQTKPETKVKIKVKNNK